MNKEKLKEIFEIAKADKKDVAIELTVPTRTATEVIIVKTDNLDYKLSYYLNNYNLFNSSDIYEHWTRSI